MIKDKLIEDMEACYFTRMKGNEIIHQGIDKEKLKQKGYEVEEEKSKLEEANEKLAEIIKLNSFHRTFANNLQHIKDLYEQDRQELINKTKCCGNCNYEYNCKPGCIEPELKYWELKDD